MFPDGECLHATIKYSDKTITCTNIKPNNIIHMKCNLGFSDKYPKYIIPDKKLYDGPNYPLIHFSVYTYQGRWAKHGTIPNRPSLWKLCEEDYYINNVIINRPSYGKNKHLTKMSYSIGNFHIVHYQTMLKKYEYHRMLMCFLGGNKWK